MIWKIAKKEFLLNLMTFKFAVGTILCVVLMAVFMPVLVNDYQQRLKDYNANVADNEAELRKVKVYKNITPTIYRQPSVLSVFSGGVERQLGNSAKITLDKVPEISAASAGDNPYLSIFVVFDASLIFKIVISVLAMLVAYDVVAGEREQGTLKLMLSGTIARYQVLLGKLVAGLLTLFVPVTISFIVGLLILLSFSMVELNGSDWSRIGLMYLATLIFISAMYNVGLLFSCLARKSAISLVLGLFFWIVCVVVIPNGSVYVASQIHPVEPKERMDAQLASIREKYISKIKEISQKFRGGAEWDVHEGAAYGNYYVLICDQRTYENKAKRHALQVPLIIEYADKAMEVEHRYFDDLLAQKYFADTFSRISPVSLYEKTMTSLAGTNLASFQYFSDKVKTYRTEVIEYIRFKTNGFSLPSYFTPSKEGEWEEYKKMGREWVEKKIPKTPPLGLQDFPRFVHQSDVIRNLQKTISDLMLLIFINVLFFALSFVAFVRYDVRSN